MRTQEIKGKQTISKDITLPKTDGDWISLGKFELLKGAKTTVSFKRNNQTKALVADALLLKPLKPSK